MLQLKNILIVVKDIERAKQFYHELFGVPVIRDFGDNIMFSGGLVLQQRDSWEQLIRSDLQAGNASELYFETSDLDKFLSDVENYPEKIEFVENVRENSWGRRTVILRDLDGHLIEVGYCSLSN